MPPQAKTPVYEHAEEATPIIRHLIENDPDHYHLRAAGVIVGALFYKHDTPLKSGGKTCWAYVKKTSYRDRVLGLPDAYIVIDAAVWENELEEEQRVALLDHELFHLVPKIEKWEYEEHEEDGEDAQGTYKRGDNKRDPVTGEWMQKAAVYEYDDAHRPKLGMRKHDIEVGFFVRMIEKHGEDSAERTQIREIVESYGQLVFHFAEPGENEQAATERRHQFAESNLPWLMAAEVNGANAGLRAAFSRFGRSAKAFKSMPAGTSVTISGGGKSVTIKGEGKATTTTE